MAEILEPPDRRVLRTRELLQKALWNLLKTKEFEQISVQDIAAEASVNRATFYDHYRDKYDLLEALVGARFCDLLAERRVQFDGSCPGALTALVLAVCDYLSEWAVGRSRREPEPHMESAVIAVVRRIVLEGWRAHRGPSTDAGPRDTGIVRTGDSAAPAVDAPAANRSPEMIAAAASWAIYGAAKEWLQTPDRCSSDEIASTIVALASPILFAGQ
ncbi:MAG TPA: TetR family transcriptional regulator [Bryobacteraceae bacterium]|nr:TetR family transcriptional regulator [Bryobacteraceae bacterium]